jgi:hypothetical protein
VSTCSVYTEHMLSIKARWTLSPIYQKIIQRWGDVTTHSGLHDALNIQDTITAFIRRERLIQYPQGTHLQGILFAYTKHMLSLHSVGVIREFHLDREKHPEEQWIRAVRFLDNEEYLIVLCTQKMAIAMLDCIHLEIDMSFKIVAGATNLFSLVGWDVYTKGMSTYAPHMLS